MKIFLRYKNLIMLVVCMLLFTACASPSNEIVKDDIKEEKYTLTSLEDAKIFTLVRSITPKKDSLSFNDLSNQEKLTTLFYLTASLDLNNDKNNMTKVMNDYFGSDATVTFENYICPEEGKNGEVLYKYNEQNGKYTYNESHGGHGGTSSYIIYNIEDIAKKNNDIIVRYKIAFSNIYDIGLPSAFFSSYTDASKYQNPVTQDVSQYCSEETYDCDDNKLIEDYKDKFKTYEYTFSYDGDNLYLKGYELK